MCFEMCKVNTLSCLSNTIYILFNQVHVNQTENNIATICKVHYILVKSGEKSCFKSCQGSINTNDNIFSHSCTLKLALGHPASTMVIPQNKQHFNFAFKNPHKCNKLIFPCQRPLTYPQVIQGDRCPPDLNQHSQII